MKPLAFINGVLFASAFAVSFGLLCVSIIYLVLLPDYEELGREIKGLFVHLSLFFALSATLGAALWANLKQLDWAGMANTAAAAHVAATFVFYLNYIGVVSWW